VVAIDFAARFCLAGDLPDSSNGSAV